MAKKQAKKRRIRREPINCPFCKEDRVPDYKNYSELGNYLTDRARIMGQARSGICSKHQRALATEIKHARHLGLLPFANKI